MSMVAFPERPPYWADVSVNLNGRFGWMEAPGMACMHAARHATMEVCGGSQNRPEREGDDWTGVYS